MLDLTLEQLAKIVCGNLARGAADARVAGFFSDTRQPARGALFVALKGERFDGHAFLGEAAQAGAAAALLQDAAKLNALDGTSCGAIVVSDVRAAFLRLAAWARLTHPARDWFAVTGSAGKTTVKDLLAHLLAATGKRVHRAAKSFNNDVGVPSTILSAPREAEAVVLELGTNHPGEIVRLAGVARPRVAAITNAGPSHLEAFGSVGHVAREKAEILSFLTRDDVAVLNADDPHLPLWRARVSGRAVTFGIEREADVRGLELEPDGLRGTRFTLALERRRFPVRLAAPGFHNVMTALAAAAAAHAAGAEPVALAEALATFRGADRRLQMHELGGVTLVDDAYNASPLSFHAALETLRPLASARRFFVVAGDMLELGEAAERFHAALGGMLAGLRPEALLTVGELAARTGQAAVEAGLPGARARACASPEAAADALLERLAPGDLVLVKGSNGMGLDRCVKRLREGLATPAASAAD